MNGPKKQIQPKQALERLEVLCVASEQCTADLYTKLSRWGITQKNADAIIRHLKANRFVDDSRFASAFTRDKLRFSHWGRFRIKLALASKKIPADIIQAALDGIDEQEYQDICCKVLRSKSTQKPTDYKSFVKLYRQAIAKGFEGSLVSALIKSALPWNGSENDC